MQRLTGNEQSIPLGASSDLKRRYTWTSTALLKRVNGREERALILVNMFIKDMPDRVERLQQTLGDSDLKHAGDIAHAIKGVAGNLGADELAKIAGDMEDYCRKGQQQQVSKLLPAFAEHFSNLIQQLNEYVTSCQLS